MKINNGHYEFTCKKCGILFSSNVSSLTHKVGRSGGYDDALCQNCPRCGYGNVIAVSFPKSPLYTAYLNYRYPTFDSKENSVNSSVEEYISNNSTDYTDNSTNHSSSSSSDSYSGGGGDFGGGGSGGDW